MGWRQEYETGYPILSSDMHQEKLVLPFEIDAAWAATHQVVAVLTGGTEQKFQHLYEMYENRGNN